MTAPINLTLKQLYLRFRKSAMCTVKR